MSNSLINELINPTAGEKKFVRLIDSIQEENSHYDFRLYFEPEGHDKFPDFVLYSPTFGISFFEIKDDSIGNVESFDLHKMKVNRKSGLIPINFDRKQLVFDYIDEFRLVGPSIPVSMLYVFPNLSELDLQQKFQFDTSRKDNPFIYKGDFLETDLFLERVKNHRKFVYRETEKSKLVALNRITRRVSQSVIHKRKDGVLEPGLFENIESESNIFVLSKKQEQTLNKFMNLRGFRFLKGHAGTGKTVLIISRADFLAKTFPNSKILITYYTSQLDGVFHHLMNKFPEQITAQRLGQFCNSKILANTIKKENNEEYKKYYSQCAEIISDSSHEYNKFYDFILVDEGQDFTPELGLIIEKLAKGKDHKNKNVLVSFDDFQALNIKEKVDTTNTFRGKQRGRVKILSDSFRTPIEVAERASRLIDEKIESVRSVKNAFILKSFKNNKEIIPWIKQAIEKARLNEKLKIELRDIAIIYPHLSALHKHVRHELNKLAIPLQYYNKTTSKSIIMESNTVKVLSSTYAKGLEFRIVFLIYFDELNEQGQETVNKKAREHLYVSMTRTKEYLFVLKCKSNSLIDLIM